MAITMKTLITFVFTILFLGSSVHCRTIASAVMEKLSQSFASSSCHRVIGDIPMGKQCATTIVREINESRDIVMEKLSQSFASSSCHRVIGDILMGKQCATTIVGEINASRDTNAALMAEKLVFSAEAIILCVTALIFSADKDAFTKEVDLAPELAKPGAITFEGYATLVNAYVMALWVCVTKRFSEAVILKVIILKKREAEMALDSDEAPTATTGL
ncbi:hypothetical protein Bca4012_081439 [Brassica carinata]